MSAANLLTQLSELGIKIAARDGQLKLSAPPGALTHELREQLAQHKAELLELLSERWSGASDQQRFIAPERTQPIPLSFAQQRLWFLDALDPGLAVYNIPLAIRLHGDLQVPALALALHDLIERHESLRTNFVADEDDQPYQQIHGFLAHAIDSIDMAGASEAELQAELARRHQQPFDLAADPLLRTHLLKLGEQEHVLLFVIHHIVCDAWSLDVLFSELVTLYEGHRHGKPVNLSPLPVQYADYALWQRQWLNSAEMSRQLDYWKQQLSDAPEVLELPTDRPRPAIQTFNGSRILKTLPASLAASLNTLAKKSSSTLFMVMLAACNVLLSRWSRQEIVVIGSPVAGRQYTELEGLIGFFINTLPLKSDLTDDPDFIALLARVRQTALDGFDNQALPFEKLVEELQPQRDQSHSPVFQVVFMLQNAPGGSDMFSGLTASGISFDYGTTKFDLNIAAAELDSGIGIEFEYNTDLFDARTIERMAGHYVRLLKAAVSQPELPVSQLPLLDDTERHTLLHEWNRTALPVDSYTTMHGAFEAQVAAQADAIAVYHASGSLSYRELNRRANVLAAQLNAHGVGPETLVGISTPRNPEMLTGLLAILKAGGAYVPLDPNYPPERVRYMLEDSQAPVLLTHTSVLDNLPDHAAEVICLDTFDFGSADAPNPGHALSGAQLAYVIYTSGSTGQPKGVCIEHGNVAALIAWADTAFTQAQWSGVLAATSICFDLSVFELFCTLGLGGRVVLVDDALGLAELPDEAEVSLINTVPSAIAELNRMGGIPESVKTINLAGEPLATALVDELYALGHIETVNDLYGPSEDTTYSTWTKREAGKPATIGRPIANTRVYLLDSQLNPTPIGVPGELCLAGSGVTRGYLNQPELTAEKYIDDPFGQPGEKLYRTGDLARYRPDGTLEYLGRLDHQVKLRGFRIELGEIETRLNQHASVATARVIIREDTPGDKTLVAYVVPEAEPVDVATLRAHLQASLPGYMVPQAIVQLDAIPLTPNGKLDRKALPAPDGSSAAHAEYVAPSTPVELALADIWTELLKAENISVHDDFFALGGHSLLATRVAARIRREFGVAIPLRMLFANPTIAQLAQLGQFATFQADAEAQPGDAQDARIPPRQQADMVPLSFAQQRLWILNEIDRANPVYNIPWATAIAGTIDQAALQRAVDELSARHEALRTSFVQQDSEPLQHIATTLKIPVEVVAVADQEAQLRAVRELSSVGFQLDQAPLIRVYLIECNDADSILLINIHHIIADGWSLDIINRELSELYDAYSTGNAVSLPPLRIQYADYALWQRDWLEHGEMDRQLAYWQNKLGDAQQALELPTSKPRPAVQTFNGAHLYRQLSRADTEAIRQLAQGRNATLFMALLTVFNILLHRYSGQDDILIGSPIAGRENDELESLIGVFINTLTLRTHIGGDESFLALLAQTRTTTLDAYEHQAVPFERIVEELQPDRDVSRSPLFQVMFILQNAPFESAKFARNETTPIDVDTGSAKFEVTLACWEHADGLGLQFEYNTDLFDARTIERMAGHYVRLLKAAVSQPELPVSQLPLLDDTERHTLLHEWNRTALPVDSYTTMHGAFEAQVAAQADAIAVYHASGSLSYRELNRRANVLAAQLNAHGVGPETLVGISTPRNPEMLTGLLAILKAGGAYVPLDPNYPPERVRYMLEDSQAPVLLTHTSVLDNLPDHAAEVICLDTFDFGSADAPNPGHALSGAQLAYVIYTSGSTGQPKGVCIEHGNVAALIAWADTAFTQAQWSGVLAATSICFDLSVFELFCTLGLGGRVVLVDDALGLAELPDEAEVSLINTVPSAIAELNRMGGIPESVKTINLAGEPLATALVDELYALGHIETVNDLYGPSEDTTYSTWTKREAGKPATIGRPIANTRVYLLDSQLNPTPIGVPGELCLAGSGVTRGYLNQPELTAEKYIDDPFGQPGEKLYRTGDLARYRPDGTLEYLGRLDHQVKLRGFRIELGEIETRLNQHASVATARVIIREDTPGDKTLVAYVVPEAEPVDVATLRAHLQASLPGYMVPQAIVQLDAIPLTPNGKLDRKALPAPDGHATLATEFVAPRTELEKTIAAVWQDLLKVDRIGIQDDFFELGGHSLLAARANVRIRNETGRDISLLALFANPNIEKLAEQISAADQPTTLATIPKRTDSDAIPLSYAQQRLWILDEIEGDSTAYNVPRAVTLSRDVNKAALQSAINELVERHEALRTCFASGDPEPVQVIAAELKVPLEVFTVETREGCRAKLEELVRDKFDLSKAPLVRFQLIECAQSDPVLLLNIHHIIADVWSLDIINRELAALYRARLANATTALPELTIQYADYALWQKQWLEAGELEIHLDYWRKHLDGTSGVLELPTDRPRPPQQTFKGAHVLRSLPPEQLDRLRALSTSSNATLFMTLLAAYQVLIFRYSGQDDIVIGTPVASRESSELDHVIGFFLNTLALRARLEGSTRFSDHLAETRTTTLEAFAHQAMPFEKLVEELQVDRDMSRSPLFQTMFIMQNAAFEELALAADDSTKADKEVGNEVAFSIGTSKFDLSLTAWEHANGLGLQFEYNTDLFDAATIERMADHFANLLNDIAARPQTQIDDLSLLTAAEQQHIVYAFNDTDVPYPPDVTPVTLVEAQRDMTPANIALRFDDQTLSYAELHASANRLARHLRKAGIQRGKRVAISCPRSIELAIGVLAAVKSGGCYVPIDPTYPAERINAMLQDSNASILLCHSSVSLPSSQTPVIELDNFDFDAGDAGNLAITPRPFDPLYCIYTSGSTGKPKGVVLKHAALANLLCWQQRHPRLKYAARTLQFASISFDVSFQEMFAAWSTGGELVMVSDELRQDLPALADYIVDSQIERLYLPFAALQPLAECWQATGSTPNLADVVVAGEQLKITETIRELFSRLDQAALHNQYGPSETHVITALTLTGDSHRWPTLPSIGTPIANSRCYVLDKQDHPVPVGVAGELHLGGAQVALGYLKRPDLNAAKFVRSPFVDQDRLYRTGDMVRYHPDGTIEFLGRADHQVKLRGYRIEPGEIEARLNELDNVEDARVILREDLPGDKKLVAYVVPSGDAIEVADLRTHLQTGLPGYMVPQAIVQIDAIPITANGKLDRKALPVPDGSAAARRDYTVPSTPVEKVLAKVWQQLLNVDAISVHDDFFELGGHSLLTIKLINELNKATGQQLSIADIFEQPTIAELATLFPADVTINIDISEMDAPRTGRNILSRSFSTIAGWFGRKAS